MGGGKTKTPHKIHFKRIEIWKSLHWSYRAYGAVYSILLVPILLRGHWLTGLVITGIFATGDLILRVLRQNFENPNAPKKLLLVDSDGIINPCSNSGKILWSNVERVRWPRNHEVGIRLFQTLKQHQLPEMFEVKPTAIEPTDLHQLYCSIRKYTAQASHENWERFCLEKAIFELGILRNPKGLPFRLAFQRFPELRNYVLARSEKPVGITKLQDTNGFLMPMILCATVHPFIYLWIGIATLISGVVNSLLITGNHWNEVTTICSWFLFAMMFFAGVSQLFSEFRPMRTSQLKHGFLVMATLCGYIILAPSVVVFLTSLSGQAGKFLAMLVAYSIFSPVFLAVYFANKEHGSNIKQLGSSATRFWDNLENTNPVCLE